jgi:hypothetical protein
VAFVLQRQRHFVHVRLRPSGNLGHVRVSCGQYYVHDSYLHGTTSSGSIEISARPQQRHWARYHALRQSRPAHPQLSQEPSLASGTGAQGLNPNKQRVVAFINEMDAEKKTPYDRVHFLPKIRDLSLVIRQSERWPQSICWLAINRVIAASSKISDDASRHGEQPTIKLFVADVRRIAF